MPKALSFLNDSYEGLIQKVIYWMYVGIEKVFLF